MLKKLWQEGKREELEGKWAAGEASGEEAAELAALHMYFIQGNREAERVRSCLEKAVASPSAFALSLRAENHFFGENGYAQDHAACRADAIAALALCGDDPSLRSVRWMASSILGWVSPSSSSSSSSASSSTSSSSSAFSPVEEKTAEELFESSVGWMREDAEEGCPIAEDWLAWRYCNGQGVGKDVAQGMEWFRRSAEHGLAWAMLWLAMRYAHADGVPADPVQALFWAQRAAAFHIPEALSLLQSLSSSSSSSSSSTSSTSSST